MKAAERKSESLITELEPWCIVRRGQLLLATPKSSSQLTNQQPATRSQAERREARGEMRRGGKRRKRREINPAGPRRVEAWTTFQQIYLVFDPGKYHQ